MLIGHYAAAFAARRLAPSAPLPLLFVASQLVDIFWALFVLLGIEKVHVIPGFTASNPLDLYFMPYTHSLVATALWALLATLLYRCYANGTRPGRSALVVGMVVASHWFCDLLVHKPDLPLGLDGPRVGFGLWDHPYASTALELGLLWLAIAFVLPAVADRRGRYLALAVLMSVIQISNLVVPPPATDVGIALSVLGLYVLLAALAWRADRA